MDIIEKFSSNLKTVLTRALCFAVEMNEEMILPEHLLWALGTQKGCIGAEILRKIGIKTAKLKKQIEYVCQNKNNKPITSGDLNVLQLADSARRIVEKAVLTANTCNHRYVGTEHLLSGILQIDTPVITKFFHEQQTDIQSLREQVSIVLKHTSKFPEMTEAINLHEKISEQEKIITTEKGNKLNALTFFGRELTSPIIQKKIDPVIGREPEIERLMEILCRRTKNNPLLIGEPGVGKTAVVEGLAKKIFEQDVPVILQNKRLFALDLALIVAGTMYRGEFEARLKQIVEEATRSDEVILFVDELHTLIGAGSATGSMDAANILKPALARGDIHCIGATTHAEYKKQIESDSALERRFQTILIDEPSVQSSIEILQGIAPHYESFHHVRITPDAIEQAVKLSTRYIQDRRLPDKAIDLLDEACAHARLHRSELGPMEKRKSIEHHIEELRRDKQNAVVEERFLDAVHLKATEELLQKELDESPVSSQQNYQTVIATEEIAWVISRMINIPLGELLLQDQERSMDIETRLKQHVLGQDVVIQTVSSALKRAKAGISHPARPLASFLFLGPSGVGKTELAKAMALHFFHQQKNLIRLDMSEYAEGFTVSKLIGAPAGYVGYKEQANLTDRVKQKPYAIVLFDEIEKAHRDVQNLLLQILEEGEIADATGKMVNFKNTIIILTSNVGLERFTSGGIGFSASDNATKKFLLEDIQTELNDRFRPELLNRLDHVCVFEPLAPNILQQILEKQLRELTERIKDHGIHLSFTKEIVHYLLEQLEPKSGARSIRQAIQKHVESILAERLLSAKCKQEKTKQFTVTIEKKQLTIRKTR